MKYTLLNNVDTSCQSENYIFLAFLTLFIYCVSIPFIIFDYNQDLNIKFFISLAVFFILSLLIIVNAKTRIKQFVFPILIMNVPGAIDNFFPSFDADIYESVSLPISIISYLDLFIIGFFLVKLFIYKEQIKVKFDYFKITFIVITIIYGFIYLFIHTSTPYSANTYAGILVFFRLFFLLIIIDEIYIDNSINIRYFYLGLLTSFILLIMDSFVYTYIFTHAERMNHSTFANNVFGNIIVLYYAIFLVYFKKKSIILFLIVISMLLLTGGKAATMSFLLLFIFIYYSKHIKKNKQIIKYIFITLFLCIIYFAYTYLATHDYIGTFSSLYTRGIIWVISIEMFSDHIFEGVGYWTWNSYKYEYDFLELGVFGTHTLWGAPYLLDAHNGYLHILSEFGIIIWILLYSIFYYVYKRVNFYYFIPFLVWLITEITNAGINKHQILVFVIFFLYIIYQTKHRTSERE
ncbi:MAG: O-antigen ligase family protein [Sulfurovum sp.]|nr:O-antigen ligase family protein [Sulfurovum sp.]